MNTDWKNIKKGDHSALKNVYESHIQLLLSYGLKYTKDIELIEDSIQEIFISIWNNRQQLSEPQSVKAYLMASLKRKIIRSLNDSYHSRNQSTDEQYLFDSPIYMDDDGVDEVDRKKLQQIQSKIDQLSPRQKEILYLKYFEGMDYDEIGQIMDMQYQSVRNLYSRAVAALRLLMSTQLIILLCQMVTSGTLLSLSLVNQ